MPHVLQYQLINSFHDTSLKLPILLAQHIQLIDPHHFIDCLNSHLIAHYGVV